MSPTPIRVMLVDDSPLALALLKKALAAYPEIEVVGTARDGREALARLPELDPAVLCTDYHMPVMDGLELTREVMANYPRPILVISTAVGPGNDATVFSLLEAGAIDVFPKPQGGLEAGGPLSAEELVRKIKIVSRVVVARRRRPTAAATAGGGAGTEVGIGVPSSVVLRPLCALPDRPAVPLRLVAIGASTGGPQALQAILTRLPASFPAPIVCVQHISPGFLGGLVLWLAAQCRLKVSVVRPGETALPGHVYFPEEDRHLVVGEGDRLASSADPPVDGHRPSVTVTFKSAALRYRRAAAAVLLTGMGKDGSVGMQAMALAGGLTIAQDEATSVVFGMPREAITLGAAREVLPVDEIAPTLLQLVR